MKAIRSGADLVVRMLEEQGVKYAFGVPGAKIDAVFNSLVDSSIQTVVCRHEQNAAFIAGGIGRMTGKAGVAIATSGPGVSNLVTGLSTATSEGDPVVALGGAVATDESLKQVHQTLDSVGLCRPVTKFSAPVDSPHVVAEVVANAFRAAESGRPGAAFISLPKDVIALPAQAEPIAMPTASGLGRADEVAIREAARAISAARTPVVMLGMLASKPRYATAVRAFLERHGLPAVGTFQSAGALGAQLLPTFGGRVGQMANQLADRLLDAADLVLTLGYDPVEYDPGIWNRGKPRTVIHADVVQAQLDRCYAPRIELIGDIAQTLDALSPGIASRQTPAALSDVLKAIAAERQSLKNYAAEKTGTPIHPLRIISALQDLIGPDMTLCLDMGSFYLWVARHLHSIRARQILISNGQQSLGVGLPWAIAASLVRPGEKVLSISGDGGFLFSSMELETAVRLRANLVHMIWIDGTYNMVAVQ